MKTRLQDVTTSFISKTINSDDPFKGFFYPSGATGLPLDMIALDIGICDKGFYYVFSKEKETMDAMKNGECVTVASEYFYRLYWKFASLFEARCFIQYEKTGREELNRYFKEIKVS